MNSGKTTAQRADLRDGLVPRSGIPLQPVLAGARNVEKYDLDKGQDQ
eukprot:gene19332-19733_t